MSKKQLSAKASIMAAAFTGLIKGLEALQASEPIFGIIMILLSVCMMVVYEVLNVKQIPEQAEKHLSNPEVLERVSRELADFIKENTTVDEKLESHTETSSSDE